MGGLIVVGGKLLTGMRLSLVIISRLVYFSIRRKRDFDYLPKVVNTQLRSYRRVNVYVNAGFMYRRNVLAQKNLSISVRAPSDLNLLGFNGMPLLNHNTCNTREG